MPRLRSFLARAVLGGLLAAPLTASPAFGAGESADPAAQAFVPGRVIVEWDAGVSGADRATARDDAETTLVRGLGAASFQLVRTDPGQPVGEALAALRADPNVKLAVRDSYDVPHGIPNDPLFGALWGLRNSGSGVGGFIGAVAGVDVGAPAAWDRAVGTPSTVVADLDSGYRFTDGDLGPVAWTNLAEAANGLDDDGNGIVDDVHGADFVGSSSDSPAIDGNPTDDNLISGGHGLHTAGTIGAAGNNGVGVTGVARNLRIMPLRVCANSPANGNVASCPSSSQILAINYAGAHGARVANMSLGGTTFNPAVRDAIAHNPQTLFVISAGNDAQDNDPGGTPHYPCAYKPQTSGIPGAIDNIVCVAATDQADEPASFSDYGATSVDLGAPGTETLSLYLGREDRFGDSFEANDFAGKWSTVSGTSGFGRTDASEDHLTSFGMTDSPHAAPAPSSVHGERSTGIPVPPGYGACIFSGRRFVSLGAGGTFTYSVLIDGIPGPSVGGIAPSDTAGSVMKPFQTVPFTGAAGRTVSVRFDYTAGSSPTSANGVWLDDLELTCYQPATAPLAYQLLEGTSMAAPHVAGAAGLLFSLDPAATVAEVRDALLASVDDAPALHGKTVTGGRLDVAAALDLLVPPGSETVLPETEIVAGPPAQSTAAQETLRFVRADADAGALECRLDAAPFAPCTSPVTVSVGLGAHAFAVRARDPFGRFDPTPAVAAWTRIDPPAAAIATSVVPRCVVPRLKGKTLAQAKRALARAACALGKVKRPKRRAHRPPPRRLVVLVCSPKPGSSRAAGAKVVLRMKAKPRRHHRR